MLPYQDPALPIDQRVEDLLSRMTLPDKAGQLFQPLTLVGGFDDPGFMGAPPLGELLDRRVSHVNILSATSARDIAAWHNAVQERALRHPLGIPVTVASDPRHHFTDNPATAMLAGPFAQFPEPLGLAAIGSEDLITRFGDLTRREYLAVGIRAALHPQIDLTTDPRWARQSTTFGEDAALTSRLGVAYIKALQGTGLGADSISVMAKHFPGGGAQKDGEDPHFPYGKEQVYPGGKFDLHLQPFRDAIAAGVAQLMPYYGVPVGMGFEEVAFGFNKDVITGLLRETLGYDGIVCTDWGILSNTFWGVEHLTYQERMAKSLEAGVDQFGGEHRTGDLVELVKNGVVAESRLDVSVRRLLRDKFRLGLFDTPFVDVERAQAVVGSAASRELGLATQAAAYTLLTNAEDGAARLPLASGLRVYAEGLSQADLGDRATLVGTVDEADVAVLRLSAPYEKRGEPMSVESFFHAGSLAFPPEDLDRIRAVAAGTPTIVDVYLDRPAILADLTGSVPTILANFGSSAEALTRILFGEAAPEGNLPFDIPSSMAAVQASNPDEPFSTANPTFRFGHGLRYTA
ncbi:glycoside hydrolase family 3 protein [Actinoplanes couchii]|uniref:beta-glucosidase n=1 Tax=Actinoplanes couchii TaxID=403638 RepID=A0ABQ3XRD1_9ACTN|nr:glycoside hydrolase family 3 N-terminal domain-containing protein [Actinoplanes couchii]MDR6320027.1 beta-glucosidase [Actinoplanes couchii]GID61066.1 beta-glucosidase [Actinoplanes couchii]